MEELLKMEMLFVKIWEKCSEDNGVFNVGMLDSNEDEKNNNYFLFFFIFFYLINY